MQCLPKGTVTLLGTYAGRDARCVFQCLLEYNVSSSVSVSSWNSWLKRDFLEPVDIMRISSSYSSWCCLSRWKPSLCLLDLIEQMHQIMQAVRINADMVAPDTVTTSSLGKPNIRLSVSKTITTELAASWCTKTWECCCWYPSAMALMLWTPGANSTWK